MIGFINTAILLTIFNLFFSILGYAYVSIKENFDRSKLRDYVTIPDSLYLKKWFHIIDVNELSPFVLTQLSETGRIYYRDFFDGCGCITKL